MWSEYTKGWRKCRQVITNRTSLESCIARKANWISIAVEKMENVLILDFEYQKSLVCAEYWPFIDIFLSDQVPINLRQEGLLLKITKKHFWLVLAARPPRMWLLDSPEIDTKKSTRLRIWCQFPLMTRPCKVKVVFPCSVGEGSKVEKNYVCISILISIYYVCISILISIYIYIYIYI
jgi:hypothetical protein